MKRIFTTVSLLLIVLSLAGCHSEKKARVNKKPSIITARLQTVPTQLYYAGTISPIQVTNVVSPVDGTIKEKRFKYGDKVKKEQLLFVLTSSKLQDDYRNALTDFLKAKEDYMNSQINFRGTQELKKAQIISDQEFLSEKSQFDNTRLSYLSAKLNLEKLIKQIPSASQTLENLSLDDIEVLKKILQTSTDSVPILADNNGIVLTPQKNTADASGSSDSSSVLDVGSEVKQGQTLLTIGDLNGITTTAQVGELVINQIKTGQSVDVTCDALPNVILHGEVEHVSAQAQSGDNSGSGSVTFPVNITVKQIKPEDIALIRVGMSTKISITIQNPAQIMLPIAAVTQNNGVSMVTVLDPKTGKAQQVPVQTGQTTLNQVAITSGLTPGQQVVVP